MVMERWTLKMAIGTWENGKWNYDRKRKMIFLTEIIDGYWLNSQRHGKEHKPIKMVSDMMGSGIKV